jgi:hypothetical protein
LGKDKLTHELIWINANCIRWFGALASRDGGAVANCGKAMMPAFDRIPDSTRTSRQVRKVSWRDLEFLRRSLMQIFLRNPEIVALIVNRIRDCQYSSARYLRRR